MRATTALPLNMETFFPDLEGIFLKCLRAIKFSPESREGENSFIREFLVVISMQCLRPSFDDLTSPEYPRANVSRWRNTGHGINKTTGVTNPVAFDLLSFDNTAFPISFK